MPLTEDQRIQMKAAERSENELGRAWELYQMYLGNGYEPPAALRLAKEAVSMWIAYQDEVAVSLPDGFDEEFIPMAALEPLFASFADNITDIVRRNLEGLAAKTKES